MNTFWCKNSVNTRVLCHAFEAYTNLDIFMKRLLFLLCLLLSFTLTYSQSKKITNVTKTSGAIKEIKPSVTSITPSKKETQDWIKEKIENFTHDFNNPGLGDYGTEKYEVEFSDCKVVISIKKDYQHQNPFNGEMTKDYFYETFEIPIKDLSILSFAKANATTTQIIFKIKSNEMLITETIEQNLSGSKEIVSSTNIASLYILNSLLIDNLPERLTKGVNHLITLCGGEVSKEVF